MTRKSEHLQDKESINSSEPLIPGLPDDIGQLCLLHLPYPYQAFARSVSSSWKETITDPRFFLSKQALSLSLPYIFVFAFHKSTGRIQWQAFDPRSRRWFILPPMPSPKAVCAPAFACTAMPHEGKLFVLGGMRSDTETSMRTTFIYRTLTNQWSIGSPMPTPRSFFAVGCVNGKILAVGGSGSGISDSVRAVECYDSESDTWSSVAKMRTGLARYDSAVVGDKMYVTEGWTWPFMFSPRGGVYDPDEDTWQEMNDGIKEGWTGVSVVLNGRLFVISEHGDCPMKVYDPEGDTWRYVGGERFPREAMQRPFAIGGGEGKVYVVACRLNVAIGRVFEGKHKEISVEWEVVSGPKAFHDFSPCSCQVLYA
ncbi:F-box protein AFR [Tripterygium wilfordii]|uniref:F-box protein AFR n=1 Tax=Tripterygium wilfordii TaxID=458696 RepID=UPI0018F84250|nr:F-box protein AFR [Tripterygium wilfordii]